MLDEERKDLSLERKTHVRLKGVPQFSIIKFYWFFKWYKINCKTSLNGKIVARFQKFMPSFIKRQNFLCHNSELKEIFVIFVFTVQFPQFSNYFQKNHLFP